MTSYSPGDVVLVRFPFTNLRHSKKRPAVVISPQSYAQRYNDVVFLALTSKPQSTGDPLLFWEDVGLPRPTWCKPVIATISTTFITRRLGALRPEDTATVQNSIGLAIGHVFQPLGPSLDDA